MLFFKPKHKIDELLPPPPPLELELEQEAKEKPKFFDELVKPKKAESISEEKEFSDLVKEIEKSTPKKPGRKNKKKISKSLTKKQKIQTNTKLKQLKKIEIKKLKEKTKQKKLAQAKPTKKKRLQLKKIKAIKKIIEKPQIREPEPEEDFGLEHIDFELPKELEEPKEELGLPETLEDFDIGKEPEQEAKPREILDAQEEIKSAIEKIKKKEKSSLFKRLFARKKKEEKPEESYPTFTVQGEDKLSIIQSDIKKARDALMRFDLETAKRDYIEIMGIYNGLSPQDKAKVYHDINELYFERKSAEELKV